MKQGMQIREVFRLGNGITVLACECNNPAEQVAGRQGLVIAAGHAPQHIRLIGERASLNQSARSDEWALETADAVNLTSDEARSGEWRLVLE